MRDTKLFFKTFSYSIKELELKKKKKADFSSWPELTPNLSTLIAKSFKCINIIVTTGGLLFHFVEKCEDK